MTDDAARALGEHGLREAMARLDADLREGRCPLASLAEVLAWLDGLARRHHDPAGAPVGDVGFDDDARALAGVRHAHAAIERDATRTGEVATFGGPGSEPRGLAQLSGALAGRMWRWQRGAVLPPAPPGHEPEDPGAARCYDSAVAKRPLAPPLQAAARSLTGR